MNTVREETNRISYHFPALIRREKIIWKWVYAVWPVILILVLCSAFMYLSLRYEAGVTAKVFINVQGVSTEQMVRKDFEKWSAERIMLFEKSLENLQMRADLIQGELRSEAQQRIERLKTMQASAQAALLKLQTCDPGFWGIARRDMTKTFWSLKKAHSHVSVYITGLMF